MALEQHQIEILEVISDLEQVSIKGLLECIIYTEERSILKEDMEALQEVGLIKKYGNGMWQITKDGKKLLKHGAKDSVPSLQPKGEIVKQPVKVEPAPDEDVTPEAEPDPTPKDEQPRSVAADNLELIQLRKDNEELRKLLRRGRDELAESYATIKKYQSVLENAECHQPTGKKLQFAAEVRERISLNTKIQVLDALSLLVAEDIAEVLDNIKQDITPE